MFFCQCVETVTYAVELFDFVQDLSRGHLKYSAFQELLPRIGVPETSVWSLRTSFQNNSARLHSAKNFGTCALWIIGAAHTSLGWVRKVKHMKLPSASHAPKLSKAAQPPLSYPGAPADSDRAKRPPLASPQPTVQELNPGDRVEGLGNFGRPTGDVGTVEQTNEEDAVVKWDGDGEMRLGRAWLKKIQPWMSKVRPWRKRV